jgi:hypothetical protein
VEFYFNLASGLFALGYQIKELDVEYLVKLISVLVSVLASKL